MSESILKPKTSGTLFFRSVAGWAAAGLLSIAAAFSVQFFDFSNLVSAQISLGIFGLAGGYSYVRLTGIMEWKVSRGLGLIISIVWALCCIGGATPMFFSLGTSLKMSVLSLYSFTFFGALGGFITGVIVMRGNGNISRDILPYILTWALSFGTAAIAGDILGEGLQVILPEIPAWFFAFGAIVLILGYGGWYSLEYILTEDKTENRTAEKHGISHGLSSGANNSLLTFALILLTLPFYLNDFANIFIRD